MAAVMPVSVAPMAVVTATAAMATTPKSWGVSNRPRTSVPRRYSAFESTFCTPFQMNARPGAAFFASLHSVRRVYFSWMPAAKPRNRSTTKARPLTLRR